MPVVIEANERFVKERPLMQSATFLMSKATLFHPFKEGMLSSWINLRTYHVPAAKHLFQEAGIELIFLPPYSPEYNPIEETWSVFKSVLKKLEARNIPQYIDALNEAKKSITPEKVKGTYRHAGYHLPD